MIIILSYPFVLASAAVDVNVDKGRRWTNSLLPSYMFVVVIIIIIITFLFTEDNILSTYKHYLKYGHHFKQMLKLYDTETLQTRWYDLKLHELTIFNMNHFL